MTALTVLQPVVHPQHGSETESDDHKEGQLCPDQVPLFHQCLHFLLHLCLRHLEIAHFFDQIGTVTMLKYLL